MGAIGKGRGGGAPVPRSGLAETLEIRDIASPLSQAVLQETRLRLLAILSSGEARRRGGYSLQELGEMLDCSPQNAHHHLKILEQAALVRVARTEATQRIPRQFWLSDTRTIRLRPIDTALLELETAAEDAQLRRPVARRLEQWAERMGGNGAHQVAERIARFFASLDEDAAAELIRILHEVRDGGSA